MEFSLNECLLFIICKNKLLCKIIINSFDSNLINYYYLL